MIGETLEEVIVGAKQLVKNKGFKKESPRGRTWSLPAVTLVWLKPLEQSQTGQARYPFWPRASEEWYQKEFVRRPAPRLPEQPARDGHEHIYPYTYCWRSRYFDGGWGYVLGVVRTAKALGRKNFCFKSTRQLKNFLLVAGTTIHISNLLSVLRWINQEMLNSWLRDSSDLEKILKLSRVDSLKVSIISQIKNPLTRRAVTASFIYPNIDHLLAATGVPVYQLYQMLELTPGRFISVHLHRALDIAGGAQLDFSHDLEWAKEVKESVAAPFSLEAIVVQASDLHIYEGHERGDRTHHNIVSWLHYVTDAYPAHNPSILKELLEREPYKTNLRLTWRHLRE